MYNNKLEHYNEIASKRLERDLKSKNIDNKSIIQYVNIFKKSSKIRFLNIKFLSLVINYYDINHNKIKILLMTKMLINEELINDKSSEELKLKYLASFIRYLYYVDEIIKNKNNIEEDYLIDKEDYEEYY